jgi:hypothetical protein
MPPCIVGELLVGNGGSRVLILDWFLLCLLRLSAFLLRCVTGFVYAMQGVTEGLRSLLSSQKVTHLVPIHQAVRSQKSAVSKYRSLTDSTPAIALVNSPAPILGIPFDKARGAPLTYFVNDLRDHVGLL